jgi:hypothetical protein
VFCCGFAVLLPVLSAMLFCLSWQLLAEGAAGIVLHVGAKHFICGSHAWAAWGSWHASC